MVDLDTEKCELEYVEDSIVDENKKRINDLVSAHWAYIKGVLDHAMADGSTYTRPQVMKMIEFHYKSSGKHFYGHGVEDTLNNAKHEVV